MNNKVTPSQKKKRISAAITIVVALVLIVTYAVQLINSDKGKTHSVSGDCAVTFIDVGQGDCTLISCGGENFLIDAGENHLGDEVVTKLKSLGITKLDLVLGTHAHSDHIGGLDVVINSIPTEKIILSDLPQKLIPSTKTYTDLLSAIVENEVELIPAEVGDSFTVGEGKITLLGPIKQYNDQNNMSVVCRFDFGEVSFMFTGDAEVKAEKDMLLSSQSFNADVLKVGHHGSDTSTSDEFLKAVGPDYAVIEVGEGNEYAHPADSTINKLEGSGAEVYRTDKNGTVTAVTDGKTVTFSAERS